MGNLNFVEGFNYVNTQGGRVECDAVGAEKAKNGGRSLCDRKPWGIMGQATHCYAPVPPGPPMKLNVRDPLGCLFFVGSFSTGQ